MTDLKLNGINVSNYVSAYSFSVNPITGGNSFTSVNGNTVTDITGNKFSLKITLERLEITMLNSIITELDKTFVTIVSENISKVSGNYSADGGYNVDLAKSNKIDFSSNLWKINFSLSRTVPLSSDNGSGNGL